MSWGKIDDHLYSHTKWLATPDGGRALWVTALSWSMSQLTDGYVPRAALPALGSTVAKAESLVRSGLWEDAEGGWQFHDWATYQPSAASVLEQRARNADRMKRARESKDKGRGGDVTPLRQV